MDIWNIDPKKIVTENSTEEKIEETITSTSSIYEMQSEKKKLFEIREDETLLSKKIEISGLYDPVRKWPYN